MKVRDLMQRRVTTITEDGTVGAALQLMLWRQVRHLPAMREGRLVGMLTERDLLRLQAAGKVGADTPIRNVMVSPVAHIHPGADVADAAADMATRQLGCLPVVDAGELVGILTRTDVLGEVAQVPLPATSAGQEESADLRARDLMTRDPVAVSPSEPLVEAAAQMAAKGIRHLCVVDSEQRILGMLSDRDLRSQIGESVMATGLAEGNASRRLSALKVQHAMTDGARTAAPDTPLADLVNIFLTENIVAVTVVDDQERLTGIVS